jgi:hypothetical protein
MRGRGFCVHKRDPHQEEGGGWHKEGEREIREKQDKHRREMEKQGKKWHPHMGEGGGRESKAGTPEHANALGSSHARSEDPSEDPWPELKKIFVWQSQSAVEADMEARKLGTGSLWGSSVAHQVASIRIEAQGVSKEAQSRSQVLDFNRSVRGSTLGNSSGGGGGGGGRRGSGSSTVSAASSLGGKPLPGEVEAAARAVAEQESARMRAVARAGSDFDSEEEQEEELRALRTAPKVRGRHRDAPRGGSHLDAENEIAHIDDAYANAHKARLGTRREGGLISLGSIDLSKLVVSTD